MEFFKSNILFDISVSAIGAILFLILRIVGQKKHFKIKSLFLITIFAVYFIVRILNSVAQPLKFDLLDSSLDLLEALLLALCVIKAIMFALVELFFYSKKGVEIPKIFQDTLFVLLYFILLMVILKEVLNINLTSILTTSAVLTMVLGLSIQDNLSNLFSGLAIQMEKPFATGEWVSFEGTIGKVKELSWRSVKLLTLENDLLIIPNNKIIKETVVNYNRPTHLHISKFNIGVAYRHPPNKVKDTILEVLKNEKDISHEPKPIIRLIDYGDFAITYEIRYYISNFNRFLQIEDSITTKLWYAFKREDITIPFPIRNVNLRTVTDEKERKKRETEIAERAAFLKSIEFLAPLSDDDTLKLAQNGRSLSFCTGEQVIKEGTDGDSMYVILQGDVDVFINDATGDRKKISTLHAGDFFGERSLMTGAKRNATIVATTDCIFFVIDKENFKNVISSHDGVLRQISDILSRRELELKDKRQEVSKPVTSTQIQENSKKIFHRIKDFLGF